MKQRFTPRAKTIDANDKATMIRLHKEFTALLRKHHEQLAMLEKTGCAKDWVIASHAKHKVPVAHLEEAHAFVTVVLPLLKDFAHCYKEASPATWERWYDHCPECNPCLLLDKTKVPIRALCKKKPKMFAKSVKYPLWSTIEVVGIESEE